MARDNFSLLFNTTAATTPTSRLNNASSSSTNSVANYSQNNKEENAHRESEKDAMPGRHSSTSTLVNGSIDQRDAGVDTRAVSEPLVTNLSSTSEDTPTNAHQQEQQSPTYYTKPGTESIQYLRKFGSNIGSIALKPLRELQLAEKLNAMNIEMEEMQNEKEIERMRHKLDAEERERRALERELQEKEEEEECRRIKEEADRACQRVAGRYDALVKFVKSCPRGSYEEFVEFLLMGGGRTQDGDLFEDYNSLLFENFYDDNSEYRRLWNDNLMLGLPKDASTVDGRMFVPAAPGSTRSTPGGDSSQDAWESIEVRQRSRTFSSDNFGQSPRERTGSEGERTKFGQALRDRLHSAEGKIDKIEQQISQVDRQTIRQGLGSAVNALSNASAYALKPLRDLQLAEQVNAMSIDLEEEETRRQIEKYNRMAEDKRDYQEMMRLKREAEEHCLNATIDHLLNFIKEKPDAKYHEWIEDFHPENVHDGALLEGLGKTIDHRFFVEESDHRRLWNDNLLTHLDPNSSKGRDFVPARASQMNDNGDVIAEDILTGSADGMGEISLNNKEIQLDGVRSSDSDLIAFD
mmetsp:Transcript_32134/g.67986  ORF Transcript_32134/g.67986 Transcript_32134/m.67986 type:complete len:578 (+) Transcript_32134:183-1916(+)